MCLKCSEDVHLVYKDKEKPKGRSTLHKWVCPDCGLAVRIGINSDPRLVHDSCSERKGEKVFLVNHDGLKHTIYENTSGEEKPKKDTPPIIDELNENLQRTASRDMKDFSVEAVAQHLGINKKVLYKWAKTDSEFSNALKRLKDVQENDPFKTGTEEDYFVNSMMVALLLMETRDRHYKPHNQ